MQCTYANLVRAAVLSAGACSAEMQRCPLHRTTTSGTAVLPASVRSTTVYCPAAHARTSSSIRYCTPGGSTAPRSGSATTRPSTSETTIVTLPAASATSSSSTTRSCTGCGSRHSRTFAAPDPSSTPGPPSVQQEGFDALCGVVVALSRNIAPIGGDGMRFN